MKEHSDESFPLKGLKSCGLEQFNVAARSAPFPTKVLEHVSLRVFKGIVLTWLSSECLFLKNSEVRVCHELLFFQIILG